MASLQRGLVVGNWKMELSHKAATELAGSLVKTLKAGAADRCDVVVCPSYPSLAAVSELLQESPIEVGAQHAHWEERGAWTGLVSVSQIRPFARWCIVGHSEQRALTGLTDERVAATTDLLVRHDISPVVCIGETAAEREADETVAVITRQVTALLASLTRAALTKVVMVYEPVWAISAAGSGAVPEPADVAGVLLLIRKLVAARFDDDIAQRLRLLYGGSVKPATVGEYVREPGVGGVLVGAASLHPMDFAHIIDTVGQEAAEG